MPGPQSGKAVRHQQIVVRFQLVQGSAKANKIAGNQPGSLVNELVEGMLSIGSRLSPDNWPGLIIHLPTFQVNVFSVALHIGLLEVGTQAPKIMVVGQDCHGLRAKEIIVPDANKPQQHREVALKGSGAEMLVHRMKARQHLVKVLGADSDHQRKANGRVKGVTATNPIPELEHICRVNAKLLYLCGVCRDGDKVFCDCLFVPPAPGRTMRRPNVR